MQPIVLDKQTIFYLIPLNFHPPFSFFNESHISQTQNESLT